jgi:TRAP-type C4-dicarboxylate transport system substrate-binding protein/beta-lactamase regulating signal transducer with metallopeptidase domain
MKNLIDSITLSLLRTTAIETLGWTLLHFLWQGTLIALILAVLVWLLRNRHPSLRYLLACTSLAVMLACPIVTYLVLDSSNSTPPVVETALPPQTQVVAEPALVNDVAAQPAVTPVVFAPEGGTGKKASWLERNLKPWLPYLVVFWGVGVLILSLRLLGGLWFLRKLRTRLTKPVSTMLVSQLNAVAERLGLARQVQLRESLAVSVPLVIGWLRPMILLPSSVMSGLSVKQLEMILAHELAHIRRHDYLVNLLQSVIETLLFYHPLVWWVSAKIRHERELCCDDLAIKVCGGDKQSYAQALADLDDLRPNMQFVQAATGGSLLKRILRLADRAMPKALEPRQWLAGLSMISISMILFTIVGANLIFAQDDEVTLRLAITDPQGRPSEAYINEFINQVTTLSGGKITIEPTWEAGLNTTPTFEQGVAKAMVAGEYDLGLAASRGWDSVGVTSLQPLQAPFLIDNDALAEAVAVSDTAKQMLEGMSAAGVVGLTLWPDVLNHPMAFDFDKPFLSPEDFAGKTIRIIGSNITTAMYDAFGAKAIVQEDWDKDVIDGLIQGTELGLAQGFAIPMAAVATGNVTYYPKYHVLVANSSSFERLSDEQRSILREAAAVIQKQAIAEHPKEVDAATAYCADGAGNIVLASDEQLAAFDEADKPVYALIEQDPKNAEYIAAIRELKANTPPSPGAVACETPTTQESSTPSSDTDTETWSEGLPPNGTWQVELTAQDVEAMGVMGSKASDWAGVYTWVLEDGKGTWLVSGPIEQANSGGCEADYAVVEDFVRFIYTAGSGCDDEVDDIQWRLEDDGLHLHLVDIKNAPFVENKAYLEAKPWQKVEVWSEGSPPNGTWQVELSLEDFQRMGVVRSWAVDWAGTYTFEFNDGKGALLFNGPSLGQPNSPNSARCDMYYEVFKDDVTRFTYTTGSSCLDIKEFHQWRLDDEGLHLHLLDITNAPFIENRAVYEAKPWQKVEVWSEGLPPNGVWQVELTEEEVVAKGLPRAEASDIVGVTNWKFQDGKFTINMLVNSPRASSCAGTYAVVEDFVRFTYTSGCYGASEDIQWRLENDEIHLHLVALKNEPFLVNKVYFEAKPWQKIE